MMKTDEMIKRNDRKSAGPENNPGHMAFRVSQQFADSHSNLTLKLLLNEIEDMRLNDVTVKQKTDNARLTALLSNINV